MTPMAAHLGYYTVPVADLERGKRFWGDLFGWTFEPGDRYAHVGNTTPPGGLVRDAAERTAKVWFRVDDIRAAVARVGELGGTAAEPSQSPSGWSSDCQDDQGTRFSLWQPAPGY
jgi:predicted enzyme related to lactoylglutathione lyase